MADVLPDPLLGVLRRGAAKWGRDPESVWDYDDVRLRVTDIVEVPLPRGRKHEYAQLRIATDDLGRWGYALRYYYRDVGHQYSALMHFCDPHESRQACLEAGLLDVEQRVRKAAARTGSIPSDGQQDLFAS